MKSILSLVFFWTMAVSSWAQGFGTSQDSILSIKRNPELIADWCTLPSEEEAMVAARRGLMKEVDNYMRNNHFKYICDSLFFPTGLVQTYSYYMETIKRYRVIAFISKTALADAEKAVALQFEEHGNCVIDVFLNALSGVHTIEDVETLLTKEGIQEYVRWGRLTAETPMSFQAFLDKGYFVYYDSSSGEIMEITAPNNKFESFLTGNKVDPLLQKGEVFWVYIKQPKK